MPYISQTETNKPYAGVVRFIYALIVSLASPVGYTSSFTLYWGLWMVFIYNNPGAVWTRFLLNSGQDDKILGVIAIVLGSITTGIYIKEFYQKTHRAINNPIALTTGATLIFWSIILAGRSSEVWRGTAFAIYSMLCVMAFIAFLQAVGITRFLRDYSTGE